MYSPLEMPDVPTITLTFDVNKSFQAVNPVLTFNDKQVNPLLGEEKKGPQNQLAENDGNHVNLTHVLLLSISTFWTWSLSSKMEMLLSCTRSISTDIIA